MRRGLGMFSHDRRTPTLTLSMLALYSAAIVQS